MGQIADILQQRGETDEVLRIRREEELPVYERLGDVRSRAVTLGQIANILQQRGETGEALRILREEALPVFERLGDVRSRAVTLGQIADILQQRGETDEALRIQLEERLPVALKLHDLDLLAHIRFSCAMIRLARGGMEKGEEQLIFDEMAESFALINQLGRVDGVTVVGRIYGPLLTKTGQIETALDVLEKTAKAFERLNMGEQAANLRGMAKKKP
jgi:tetratricopeptide (TPR) repeat protein